jgi:hypothetical protein
LGRVRRGLLGTRKKEVLMHKGNLEKGKGSHPGEVARGHNKIFREKAVEVWLQYRKSSDFCLHKKDGYERIRKIAILNTASRP